MKRISAVFLALAPLLVLVIPAYASATPSTMTFHDLTASMKVTPIVCPDGSTIPGGTLTTTSNGVMHNSTDSNGGFHVTATISASFILVSTSGVTFTGHFTAWFGGTAHVTSTGASEFGFTFSAHGTGTDGTKLDFHMSQHMTINPDGTITSTFMNLRC